MEGNECVVDVAALPTASSDLLRAVWTLLKSGVEVEGRGTKVRGTLAG